MPHGRADHASGGEVPLVVETVYLPFSDPSCSWLRVELVLLLLWHPFFVCMARSARLGSGRTELNFLLASYLGFLCSSTLLLSSPIWPSSATRPMLTSRSLSKIHAPQSYSSGRPSACGHSENKWRRRLLDLQHIVNPLKHVERLKQVDLNVWQIEDVEYVLSEEEIP